MPHNTVAVAQNMEDLFDLVKFTSISLPAFKENGLKISFKEPRKCSPRYQGKEPTLPFAESEIFEAPILQWRRLTNYRNDESKRTYEVTFDVTGSNFQFRPGDTIGVMPQNIADEVEGILEHLGLSAVANCPYEITVDSNAKGARIPGHIPIESTLRHVFTHALDFRGVIKKQFLLALSRHTKNESERKVLQYLSSKEGSTTYNTHILGKRYCLIDLLKLFPSCQPTAEDLFAHLPRLLPRPYSIANSQIKDKHVLKICFSVMNIDQERKGLTTGYLEDVLLNEDMIENCLSRLSITKSNNRLISIYLRKNMSGFVMPEIEIPLLLIGPGTGVAPFIGFLEERSFLKERNSTRTLGETWLYFGCRDPDADHIYKKEMNGFVEEGTLAKLSTAFSRIDNGGVKYVQDALNQEGEEVIAFVERGAFIFVCGDLRTMAVEVRDTLKKCFVQHRGKSVKEAEDYIIELEKEKRYLVDIWS